MSFGRDIDRFMDEEVPKQLQKEMQTIVQFGLGFAKQTCPVLTGHYRRNIEHSEGSVGGGSTTGMVNDPFKDQFIYVLDSVVPYAMRIEYDGWSQKAPAGVFGVTASAMRSRFNL